MFNPLIEVLKTDGYGIHGFQKCAALALQLGLEDVKVSAPYLLLSTAAEHFVNLYEGEPLPTQVAEEEYQRLEGYVSKFNEAFSKNDESHRVAALNEVAADILESKRA